MQYIPPQGGAEVVGNATPSDVVSPKTFSSASAGIGQVGTIIPQLGGVIFPSTSNQVIDPGYYTEPHVVTGDADLLPGNIRIGVDLFGIAGTYAGVPGTGGTAAAAQILSPQTATIGTTGSATQVTGTMQNRGAVSQNIANQNGSYTIPEGYHNGSGIVQAAITNLVSGNIRNGVSVGGVAGTFIGSISPGTGAIFRRTNYANNSSSTPYEVVGIIFNMPGTIRISFDLYTSSTNARAQIYKNGVPFGIARSTSSSVPTTYTQDIDFVSGDKISIYLWGTGGTTSSSIENIIYGSSLLTITQE